MSSSQVSSETASETPERTVDMKLEVVVIPVSDVDRAKRFYCDLGWRLDADFVVKATAVMSSDNGGARAPNSDVTGTRLYIGSGVTGERPKVGRSAFTCFVLSSLLWARPRQRCGVCKVISSLVEAA